MQSFPAATMTLFMAGLFLANAPISQADEAGKDEGIVLVAGDDSKQVTSKVYLETDKLQAGGQTRFAVVLDIDHGWHINTNPAKPDFLVPTAVAVKSKLGTKPVQIKYPEGKPINVDGFDEPLMSYEGRVVLFGVLSAPQNAGGQTETIAVAVRYQACNDSQCLRPTIDKLTGQIRVAAPGESVQKVNEKLFNPRTAAKN
ncbi:protein-disulfide reductase DsbD domain-containing protein [Calycomorphotria hydatis]|uniref:Thiol:disulfide interchange protein DsbD N-terminal domain-containing protein n=1 Tax=Calycomorphotria hydatis TaxID=2528027 RepID=A0A517TBP4_9PLAN|nr:protein-disulfide reductase DsbD domain-containing protein [Calycomorphotria hydatis]QDT65789.1 hypothetical protein V22_30510 [Calycomorphotria hydatis]